MAIISEKRTFTDGRLETRFEMASDAQPTREEVAESQIRCGYHPAGYGGPYQIKTRQEDGKFITNWSCAGSCD